MLFKIKRWLEPPIFPNDEEKTTQARTMNAVGLYLFLALVIAAVIFVPFFAQQKMVSWVVVLSLLVLYGVCRYFMFRGYLTLASMLMVIAGWILCVELVLVGGGITSPMTVMVVAITIVIGLLFRSYIGNIFLIVSVLAGLGMAILQQSGIILPRLFTYSPISAWFLLALALIFMNLTMNLSMRNLENAAVVARQQSAARQQAEQALHQSEERFQMFMQYFPGLAYIKDSSGRTLFANRGFSSFLGLDPKDMIGKTNLEIFGPEFGEIITRDDRRVLETGISQIIEEEFAGKTWTTHKFCIDQSNASPLLAGVTIDMTERKLAEEALSLNEKRLRQIIDLVPHFIFAKNSKGRFILVNQAIADAYGTTVQELTGKVDADFIHSEEEVRHFLEDDNKVISSGLPKIIPEELITDAAGNVRILSTQKIPFTFSGSTLPSLLGVSVDITEQKRTEESLRKSEKSYRGLFNSVEEAIYILDANSRFLDVNDGALKMYGYPKEFFVGQTPEVVSAPGRNDLTKVTQAIQDAFKGEPQQFEFWGLRSNGKIFLKDIRLYKGTYFGQDVIIALAQDITERKQTEERIQLSEKKFRELFEVSKDGISIFVVSPDWTSRVFVELNDAAHAMLGYSKEEMLRLPPGMLELDLTTEQIQLRQTELNANGAANFETILAHKDGHRVYTEFTSQLIQYEGQLAVMNIVRDVTERKQHERELQAITTLSSALRIARTRIEMLPVIVEQIINLLNCDSATIEIMEPQTGDAIVEAAHGIWEHLAGSRQKKGTGINAIISQTRKPYYTDNLKDDPNLVYSEWAYGGIRSCVGVPLIAQDNLIGYIWVGQRTNISGTKIRLLSAIADIAANAIFRATLHELTLKDASDLALAYDRTLEGWAHALELRDQETEGHARRVVQMTIDLARSMNVSEEEIEDIRRGALLHDIGKMGIPDSILLKAGSLNEGEWEIMQRHPEYAYNLLMPIEYLRPALDIPYCHHEKWDGTGYPSRLKGEAIPLAARIFAIVDVWDALTADRPYRPAWSKEKALDYVREQNGKHFDPQLVGVFLDMIDQLES
jgi:PAS domain S-box-containing protein